MTDDVDLLERLRAHGRRLDERAPLPAPAELRVFSDSPGGALRRPLLVSAAVVLVAATAAVLLVDRGGDQHVQVDAPQETTTTAAQSPARPDHLLVAGPDGIFAEREGERIEMTEQPASVAVSDGRGGVLYQLVSAWSPDGDSTIWWSAGEGARPTPLVTPGDDEVLTLHDAAVVDGSAWVFYTADLRTGVPDTARQRLYRRDLDTGETVDLGVVGGWEASSGPISVGGGIIARQWRGEAHIRFYFENINGEPVNLAANPYDDDQTCADDVRCPSLVTISPDGSHIAFVQGVMPNDVVTGHDVVILKAGTGTEVLRVHLPLVEGLRLHNLDLAADHLIVNRADADDSPSQPLVIYRATEASEELSNRGFTRIDPLQ